MQIFSDAIIHIKSYLINHFYVNRTVFLFFQYGILEFLKILSFNFFSNSYIVKFSSLSIIKLFFNFLKRLRLLFEFF
jgi:hypothetical protein